MIDCERKIREVSRKESLVKVTTVVYPLPLTRNLDGGLASPNDLHRRDYWLDLGAWWQSGLAMHGRAADLRMIAPMTVEQTPHIL
jgi:hypothetical protein